MAKDLTPNLAKLIVENPHIIIYQDTAGKYWRVMKAFGNTRFPIVVVDSSETVKAPEVTQTVINAEELI